jgi:hypothetical protein
MASTWRTGLYFGLVVSAVACADALRLDIPEGAGPATTGQGGGGTACRSNSDCADPKAVCDSAKSTCVECLSVLDCAAKPGTVCSKAQCVCGGGLSYCGPNRCVDFKTSQTDCGSCGHGCFGVCANGTCADPWEPVATEGAPTARSNHLAVWTGTQMIVWGGTNNNGGFEVTGGMYDPAKYQWTPTAVVGAPSPRKRATAVWSGKYMIVWGGQDSSDAFLNDGAMFDPATNAWTPMSPAAAPGPRAGHIAVWSATKNVMVIWGGTDSAGNPPATYLSSGARFDPGTNSWSQIVNPPTPNQSRERACATWDSGQDRVFIYGGRGDDISGAVKNKVFPDGNVPGGLVYLVQSDSFTNANTSTQPSPRVDCTVLTDNTKFFVFGGASAISGDSGFLNSGATFDGQSTWTPFGGSPPAGRHDHTAVLLKNNLRMIIFGGRTGQALDSGAIFDTAGNQWLQEVPRILSPRFSHTAVSTGEKMIVWGGTNGSTKLNDGGVYTPPPIM